ncbi:MAG: hypothetical protein GF370_02740 [Candidatus Nealsonbacteria bacterium]|nr:hypothetical protein [Candidatus Nealsonbacteria bacterium]
MKKTLKEKVDDLETWVNAGLEESKSLKEKVESLEKKIQGEEEPANNEKESEGKQEKSLEERIDIIEKAIKRIEYILEHQIGINDAELHGHINKM